MARANYEGAEIKVIMSYEDGSEVIQKVGHKLKFKMKQKCDRGTVLLSR